MGGVGLGAGNAGGGGTLALVLALAATGANLFLGGPFGFRGLGPFFAIYRAVPH